MNVLIFGRAFAGMGAACIFVSVLSIISEVNCCRRCATLVIDKVQITRLKDRPVMMGTFGAVFALASVLGPLLGKQNLQEVSELSSPSRQAARSLITSAGDGVSTLICLCVMMKETRV